LAKVKKKSFFSKKHGFTTFKKTAYVENKKQRKFLPAISYGL
jgi:hypothetical protein